MNGHFILIYDGVCNLCEASVIFIIRRDRHRKFRFVPAQSPLGRNLQKRHGIHALEDGTVILLKQGRIYTKSDAAIETAKHLDGSWKLLGLLKILPKSVRDRGYDWIAANRYKWFGRKKECMIPTQDLADRFPDRLA